MQNLSYENALYSQVHSNANQTHFHLNGFASVGLSFEIEARENSQMACAQETQTKSIFPNLNVSFVNQDFSSFGYD